MMWGTKIFASIWASIRSDTSWLERVEAKEAWKFEYYRLEERT